jgi:hypothetical protein
MGLGENERMSIPVPRDMLPEPPLYCLVCGQPVDVDDAEAGQHDCPGPPGLEWLNLAEGSHYGGKPVSRAWWRPVPRVG